MSARAFGLGVAAFVAGVLAAHPARALDPLKSPSQYVTHRWQQADDGLPENYAPAIVQTRDGYIWLGSQEGLVRFDGVRFLVFTTKEVPELTTNDVEQLCEDKNGALWIGTNGGGLVRYAEGKFTRFTEADGLPDDTITLIQETHEGVLWIGTARGVVTWDGAKLSAVPGVARAVTMDEQPDGTLWLGAGKSLLRVSGGVVTTVKAGLSRLGAVAADADGTVWLGSASGLDRWQNGVLTPLGQDVGVVQALLRDRQGNLWVGADSGLWRVSSVPEAAGTPTPLGLLSRLDTEAGDQFNVVSFAEDREGNLWVGGENGSGVLQLQDGKVTTFGSSFIWSTYLDVHGMIWLGAGPGLFEVHGDRIDPTPAVVSFNVGGITQNGADGLWLGTRERGVVAYKNGALSRWAGDPMFASGEIRSLYTDSHGALWLGTNYGLSRIDHGTVTHFGPKDGVPNVVVRVFAEPGDGTMWIGTAEGLLHLKDGKFTRLTTKDGLADDSLESLYSDGDDLWIGTYGGGLDLLRGGKFGHISTKNGLFNDVVYSILDDQAGSLWMSCNRGIYHAKKSELAEVATGKRASVVSTSIGTSDGMRSSECNGGNPAGVRAPDGTLWFPTTVGAVRVDPDHMRKNLVSPPVLIEALRVDRVPLDIHGLGPLPAGSRDFEIGYTALSFTAPERVRFKYKLGGFDKDWVDAGDRRVAYYTNLAPGAYRFDVIAANDDGVWNNVGANLAFVLRPHFYQTLPFYLVCALGLVLLGAGSVRLRLVALRDRATELERNVEERTLALAQASVELAGAFRALEEKDKRVHEDLLQAKAFQERILPKLPSGGAVRFRAVYRPADLVGGDLYDVTELGEGHYRLFMADTTGHGVQASLRTMVLKTEYDRVKLAEEGPARVLSELNRKLATVYPDLSMRSSACCIDVLVDDEGATLRYANAAHPPLLRVSEGKVDEIYGSGTFLGIMADAPFAEKEERLAPHERLVVYTDGIIEQEDPAGHPFGMDRLMEILAAKPRDAEEIVHDLNAALTAFAAGRPMDDDVVLLCMESAGDRRSMVSVTSASWPAKAEKPEKNT